MRRIFKYQLDIIGVQLISMPVGAQILTVQTQRHIVAMWALIEDDAPIEERLIYTRGTGHEAPNFTKVEYIATYQTGDLVWHVFDGGPYNKETKQ